MCVLMLLTLFICIGLLVFQYTHQDYIIVNDNNSKVDSLNNEIDKNLLKIENNKIVLNTLENDFEKEYNIILVQPLDSDIVFFSKYLSQGLQ